MSQGSIHDQHILAQRFHEVINVERKDYEQALSTGDLQNANWHKQHALQLYLQKRNYMRQQGFHSWTINKNGIQKYQLKSKI